MTDTTTRTASSEFRVGAVLGRSFGLLGTNFVKFAGLAAITWMPFAALTVMSAFDGTGAAGSFRPTPGAGLAVWLGVALFWASSIFVQAVILYGAFQAMRNQNFAVGQSLKVGLARFFPVIGLLVCMGIVIALASLVVSIPLMILALILAATLHAAGPLVLAATIVPAMFVAFAAIYVMWSVAVPVCVIERKGPFASLGRSRALTKGSRWKVFGVILLLVLVNLLVQGALTFGLTALAGAVAVAVGSFIWAAVAGAYSSIAVAVIYHDLRVAKEGVDVDRIIGVFD